MLKNRYLQILAISAILCAAYTLWIAALKPVRVADLKIIDAYFALDSNIRPLPKCGNDISVVTVDDESLRRINIRWPWPRNVIAGIINRISQASPRLICADLVFAGKSVDPQDDAALIDTLKNAKNVLGAAYFGSDGRYVIPDEPIALGLADFGFVNKPRDADDAVRRMRPYFISPSGRIIDYSLSLKAAGHAMNTPVSALAMLLPLSKDGTAYIKFFGKADRFKVIPVWQIIEGTADNSSLKDKTVFFGVTSESFHDTYSTPLGMMPGLIIDLNEALTCMDKSFFLYAKDNINLLIVFVFALVAVTCALSLPLLAGIFVSIVLIAVSFFFGFILFSRHVITDVFGPVFLVIASTVLLHGIRSILLAVENIVLRKESTTDGLTGLYVYRYFELQLKRELKNALSGRKNLALVIYDIDHFKNINDSYGHEFGNLILKAIAKNLKDLSRKDNIIARYGGEEFCVIIPEMKRDDAVKYAERLRNMVGTLDFKTDKGENVKVTMSAGIAMIEDARSKDYSDFIKAADSALYSSKNDGRDRITVFKRITSS